MQLVSLDKSRSTQLFYLVAGLLAAVFLLTAKQDDPGVVAAGIILAIASIYPLYFWLLGLSHGLPIWPVFVASNGILAALPMIQDSENLTAYTSGEIIVGGFTFVGFFALGTVIWLSLTGRQRKPPEAVLMISREHSERYLFIFVVLGLLFYLNQLAWIIPFPGNTMQIARGITGSLSTLGIFVLAFYNGQGLLKRSQSIWLAVLATLTALAGAAGLIMATAIVPVAMLMMGYALGSGKVPWKSLAAVLLVAAILHPGKFAMRELYWGPDRPAFRLTMLPQFYADWFGYGIDQVATMTGVSQKLTEDELASSLFERSGVLHMLLLVQKKSPDEVPFLNGLTYEPIPRLLIPRFIDSDKGISHAGNVLLTVNYGVQTLEQTRTTSIGWGLVPEAYANFGYVGVAALAVLLAMFYSWVTNISVGVPMTSLRFVLGLLIMAAATKADTMGVFITSQFQGIVGVSLAALVLMRRQRNPFAAEAANGGLQDYGTTGRGGIRHEATGKWQTAYGMRQEDGMPAPGVLTGLIEGAQPEAGDAGGAVFQKDGVSVGENGIRHEAGGTWQTANGRLHETDGMRQVERSGTGGAAEGKLIDQESKRPKDGSERLAGDGGTVRTMPIRTPQRIARWMPRRVRAAVVAQQQTAADAKGMRHEASGGEQEAAEAHTADGKRHTDSGRPRQLAVPYRNYRRYRSG